MTTEAVEGVLPLDQPLPKFSLVEEKMGMSYRGWMNSYLARLAVFCADTEAIGERPSLKAFHESQTEARGHTLSRLGSTVAQAAGVQVSRGAGGLKDVLPRPLTPEEAEEALQTWKRTYRSAGANANANDKNGQTSVESRASLTEKSLLTQAVVGAFGGRFPDHPIGITPGELVKLTRKAFPRTEVDAGMSQASLNDIRKKIAKDLHGSAPESRRIMFQELVDMAGGHEAVVAFAEQLESDLRTGARLKTRKTIEPGLQILGWLAISPKQQVKNTLG